MLPLTRARMIGFKARMEVVMSSDSGSPIPDPAPPTEAEWETARRALAASMRRASIAELGGFRPLDMAVSSWWGGNFVGAPGEAVPVCVQTGRIMHPVLQNPARSAALCAG